MRNRARLMRFLSAAILGLAVAALPLGAATASPDPRGAVGALGGTNDFTFESFDGVYELGRDGSDRSTLRVTETFVAVFPDFDQNHGIYRVIPGTYDGHPTQFHLESITDAGGSRWNYEQGFEDGNIYLQIGDGDRYVHGTQTFVITYTLKDVTRYFADTNDDEFYWDTNGVLWAQPFGRVTATVKLGDGLASSLTSASCYYGYEGSTDQCEATAEGDTITASVENLSAYQNLTVVAAFPKGTFAEAPFDLFAYLPFPLLLGLGTMLSGAVVALVLRFTVLRGEKGTGIVVAQYEPQEDISPFMAANLLGKTKKGMAAALVDLAVRRKIRIVEKPDDGLFAFGNTFGVQRTGDETDLDADDRRVLDALFATSGFRLLTRMLGRQNAPGLITIGQAAAAAEPAVDAGEVRWLTKRDQILGQQVVAITKLTAADAQRRKLRRKPQALPIVIVLLLMVAGFLLTLFGGMGATSEIGIVLGVFGSIIAAWIGVGALIMLGARRPLTKEGALAVEHLEGLREYIRLAEADRLQMLQSVTGADRVATDAGSVIKIYEKLLPYAVLFGLEKEWAKELGKYYDETPPDWYQGNVAAFNVAAFTTGIASLSSSVSASYSGASSSSSSGGSGGGGSSGGGGGGGGGGGW